MKTIDIRINEKLIRRYEPCLDGLANFNEHYTDISIKKLINSKKISYEHKVWLLRIIVPIDLLVLWAIDSSFAAYKYPDITAAANAADHATNAAYYATKADDYATNAAANYANAAYFAIKAADYAIKADYHATFYAAKAKKERLQSLLYFIENED
jgi:hypothetical protein